MILWGKRKMKVAMVVLNYNDYNTTLNFISYVKDYPIIDNVIVVDNCSTDDSVNIIAPVCVGKVVLLRSLKNAGYAAGNNIGARYAVNNCGADIVIISNPDIYIDESSIRKIIYPLCHEYSMSTGLIYNYDKKSGTKTLASNFGWKVPNYLQMLCGCFLTTYKVSRMLGKSIYLDYKQHRCENYILTEAVPGCFFAITARALKKIGYFDESTFLFGEETILGWKLKQQGLKSCIVNNAHVFHENSVSIGKNIKKDGIKYKFRYQSEEIFIKEYLKCNKLQCYIFFALYWLGTKEKRLVKHFTTCKHT